MDQGRAWQGAPGQEREAAPESAPLVAPSAPVAAQVLALQRSAGNAAVAAMLARRPAGAPVLARNGEKGDVLPEPVAVNWAGDPFTLSFAHTADERFEFVLTYGGPHPFDGVGVNGKVARFGVRIGPAPLKAQVIRNDATTVAVDLYGDGSRVVKLVDQATLDDRPSTKGRKHDLAAVDRGSSVDTGLIWVHDPKAAKTDLPVVTPEESPGSNPESKMVGDGAAEITIDGDGDQYKELTLTLKATSKWDDSDAAKGVSVKILQRSTGQVREVTFELPRPTIQGMMWPVVREVSDGKAPTRINLVLPVDTKVLEIFPPSGADNTYVVKAAGAESRVTFPAEAGGLHKTVTAENARIIGNIIAADLTLGAYNDHVPDHGREPRRRQGGALDRRRLRGHDEGRAGRRPADQRAAEVLDPQYRGDQRRARPQRRRQAGRHAQRPPHHARPGRSRPRPIATIRSGRAGRPWRAARRRSTSRSATARCSRA